MIILKRIGNRIYSLSDWILNSDLLFPERIKRDFILTIKYKPYPCIPTTHVHTFIHVWFILNVLRCAKGVQQANRYNGQRNSRADRKTDKVICGGHYAPKRAIMSNGLCLKRQKCFFFIELKGKHELPKKKKKTFF